MTVGALRPRAQPYHLTLDQREQPSVLESWLIGITIVYLIANRVFPDTYVLPAGVSIRPYEILLAFIALSWFLLRATEPRPMPSGTVGLFGLLFLVFLFITPWAHGLSLTPFESNGAERGMFRVGLYLGLFLTGYHLSFRLAAARRMVGWWLAVTGFQAIVSIIEFVQRTPLTTFDTLAETVGLVYDPKSIRVEADTIELRLTGEVRAVATAPQPIVLSALVATGVMASLAWFLTAQTRRERRWAGFSVAASLIGLPASNSRTGFIMLFALTPVLLFVASRFVHRFNTAAIYGFVLLAISFAVSPGTPRLLLNSLTRPEEDPNTTVRLERFALVPELLGRRPAFGAGYQTHDVDIQLFDNGYNLGLIEFGIVGLALYLIFFLVVANQCRKGAHLASDREALVPLIGLMASVGFLVSSATFDAQAFDQYLPSVLFLMGLGAGRSRIILEREHLKPTPHGGRLEETAPPRESRPPARPERTRARTPIPERQLLIAGRPSGDALFDTWRAAASLETIGVPLAVGGTGTQLDTEEGRALSVLTSAAFRRTATDIHMVRPTLPQLAWTRILGSTSARVVIHSSLGGLGLERMRHARSTRFGLRIAWVRWCLQKAHRVVVADEFTRSVLTSMRIEADKIDVSRLLLPREFTRKGKREPGPFRLVYHGPLDETAIGSIVVAGAFLRERMDIEMTFVGTGQLAGPAAELIDTLPDPEIVTVVSTQDIEEAERLIESADAGIVLRYGRDWSPSPAIFDFMRCAIPVVAEMNAVTLDLLGDERGTIVPRGEPISLADAVYRLNAAGAIRRSIGLRGLRRIEHLSWRADREVLAGGAVKQGQP